MWEFRNLIGKRADAIWSELLSIADRNEGELPGCLDAYPSLIAHACHSTASTVRSAIHWLTVARGKRQLPWVTVESDGTARITNHSKYHTSRDDKENPGGKVIPSLPSEPSYPNLPKKSLMSTLHVDDTLFDKPEKDKPEISVKEFVESWNQEFSGQLPAVQWPLSASRQRKAALRINEHKNLEFWNQVFSNIDASAFLLGKNNGAWRCTFDFLVANDTNCIKIYEGAYSGKSR